VRTRKAFTLAEMLAVIGIMLVLMVATFGVFNIFAQRMGPQTSLATVQAMLNGARDYAATNGVLARINFTADPRKPEEGTVMTLQYRDASSGTWEAVRGRRPVSLKDNLYVLRDMPAIPTPPSVASDPRVVREAEVTAWKQYEKQVADAVTAFACSDGKIVSPHTDFYVVFDPAGYMRISDDAPGKCALYGLTVVQIGGTRVVAYAFYPLNANTGTRVVFD